MNTPQTNPPPPTRAAANVQNPDVIRLVVEAVAQPSNVRVAKCRMFAGAASVYWVNISGSVIVGQKIFAARPIGGTGETVNPSSGGVGTGAAGSATNLQVEWVQITGGALPPGQGIYKVLMLKDDLNPGTPGWDYPRFH